MINKVDIKEIIAQGMPNELELALQNNPALANEKIHLDKHSSDPLHLISDCIFNGILHNGSEAELTKILLHHGAALNGSEDSETPLIGAVSLGAESVAEVLLDAGADIYPTSVHGSTALHWAAYMGLPNIVERLLALGADTETRCSSFTSTPLFWAVHAIRYGASPDIDAISAAIKVLIDHGADTTTENFEGYAVKKLALDTGNQKIIELLNAA